jgi:NADP-dependent 3-hydroxy acid dehydrogenase YdfG
LTRWRTALITGASSGIGAALAARLAADGTEVVLAARRADALAEMEAAIVAKGGRARSLVMDVTDADAVAHAVRRVDDEIGGLDLIVANAGVGRPQPARSLSWESAAPVLMTNLVGAVATLTAVLPRMIERRRGHLVGISSVAVMSPVPGGSVYRATKCGLTAFLENLHAELGGTNVSVSAVHPGFVRTPLADAFAIQPPFVLEAETAAQIIARRLARRPLRIDFPWQVVLGMRLVGALPRSVRDALIRRTELGPPSTTPALRP